MIIVDAHQDDFYRSLRRKVQQFLASKGSGFRHADLLMAAPDLFHLLCKLALDKRVTFASKALIASAIAYFVSPMDVVPEGLLGPAGYVDDVAVAALVLNRTINEGNAEIAAEHWAGDGQLLQLLQRILHGADQMVGTGTWSRVKRWF